MAGAATRRAIPRLVESGPAPTDIVIIVIIMLVAARLIVLDARTVLTDAALRVRRGRVERVGGRSRLLASRGPRERLLDLGDATLLPGLVNAHVHLDLSALDGSPLRGRPFAEWLRWIVRERRALSERRAAVALRRALDGALLSGTTAFGDISGAGLSASALRASGARGVVFEEVIALDPDRSRDAERAIRRRLAAAGGDSARVRRGLSPHAPYSVSRELLRRCVRLARDRRLPLAIHAAETREEREFVARGTGPLRGFLEEIGVVPRGFVAPGGGKGPIDLLAALGVLGPGTVLAHGNDLEPGEIDRIAASGAAVVFCPGTHRFFGRGAHPLGKLLAAGARAALGTDGLTSNESLDMFAEMRTAAEILSGVRPETIFDLATRGGSAALGLEGAGRLGPGSLADLVAVAPERAGSLRARDAVAALALGGPRETLLVLVGGREPGSGVKSAVAPRRRPASAAARHHRMRPRTP